MHLMLLCTFSQHMTVLTGWRSHNFQAVSSPDRLLIDNRPHQGRRIGKCREEPESSHTGFAGRVEAGRNSVEGVTLGRRIGHVGCNWPPANPLKGSRAEYITIYYYVCSMASR